MSPAHSRRTIADPLFSVSHPDLRAMKPPFFRPRGLALLPGFAQQMSQLYTELEPLALIFRFTLAHEEPTSQWISADTARQDLLACVEITSHFRVPAV